MSFNRWRSLVDGTEIDVSPIPDSEIYYELVDGDWNDDSGNGNDATPTGSWTFVSAGVQMDTDWLDNRAESPDIGLNGDDTATIGLKITPDESLTSSSGGRGWIGVHSGNNAWLLGYEGGDIVLQSLDGGTAQDTLRHTVDLNQGTTHTVAARSNAQEWAIFLDGASVASLSASSGPSVGKSGSLYLPSWTGDGGFATGTVTTSVLADVWAADRAVADSKIP